MNRRLRWDGGVGEEGSALVGGWEEVVEGGGQGGRRCREEVREERHSVEERGRRGFRRKDSQGARTELNDDGERRRRRRAGERPRASRSRAEVHDERRAEQ